MFFGAEWFDLERISHLPLHGSNFDFGKIGGMDSVPQHTACWVYGETCIAHLWKDLLPFIGKKLNLIKQRLKN